MDPQQGAGDLIFHLAPWRSEHRSCQPALRFISSHPILLGVDVVMQHDNDAMDSRLRAAGCWLLKTKDWILENRHWGWKVVQICLHMMHLWIISRQHSATGRTYVQFWGGTAHVCTYSVHTYMYVSCRPGKEVHAINCALLSFDDGGATGLLQCQMNRISCTFRGCRKDKIAGRRDG